MDSKGAIAAVAILFALGPIIIVNQAFAYGAVVGYGNYTTYVGYHHHHHQHHHHYYGGNGPYSGGYGDYGY